MFCPECKTEYRDGFFECSDCQVPLVPELPAQSEARPGPGREPQPELKLVTVLTTGNRVAIGLAKSLLANARIEYLVKNEGVQDLFGAGRLGGFNPIVGPVRIQVRLEDEDLARSLLEHLEEVDSSDVAKPPQS